VEAETEPVGAPIHEEEEIVPDWLKPIAEETPPEEVEEENLI
jgi:hypothetical protein